MTWFGLATLSKTLSKVTIYLTEKKSLFKFLQVQKLKEKEKKLQFFFLSIKFLKIYAYLSKTAVQFTSIQCKIFQNMCLIEI